MSTQQPREIEVDSGRKIRIYDDVFDLLFRSLLFTFAKNSLFRIGWADSQILERLQHQSLYSEYSIADIQNVGLLSKLLNSPLQHELNGYVFKKGMLNLSTHADVNFVHAHKEDKIILLYINMEWQDGWHGETLFFSESRKDVVFASPYTPNRAIVFDPKIPHAIRPQSHLAPFYRFTLALIFDEAPTPPTDTI